MSINFGQPKKASHQITVQVPADESGAKPEPKKFNVVYSYMPQAEFAKTLADDVEISEVIHGWDLTDFDGNDIAFNKKNVKEVLEWGFFRTAIGHGFIELHTGAREKN